MQAFDYFRLHAARDLSGLFSCAVYNHLILQGSHQETTLLRASIAVGAIYQSRQTWNAASDVARLDQRPHVLALSQYSKAVVDLRAYIDRSNGQRDDMIVSVVLMTCLLFISFEMLQGNCGTVNSHLIKGLKVLVEHVGVKSIRALQMRATTARNSAPSDIDDLSEVFIRLDTDSTMFRRRSPYIQPNMQTIGSGIDVPSSFGNVKEAKVHLDTLSSLVFEVRGQLLKFSEQRLLAANGVPSDFARHYCIAYAKARRLDPSLLPHFAGQRQTLLNAFEKWDSALTTLQSRKGKNQAIVHLRIARFLPYFLLSTLQDTVEILSDRFEPEFQEVVDLAVEFVNSSPQSSERYRFVPESGILASLYLVAVKCRNSSLRRKAADLLTASTIQEGLWSGCVYGRCVKRFIELEESRARCVFGQDDDVNYVPEEARFSDLIIDTGSDGPRFGRIICARFRDDAEDELEIIEDRFALNN